MVEAKQADKSGEKMLSAPAGPSRRHVPRMFDRIAGRYDLLNRLLSMRRDIVWRKHMARALPPGADLRLLDLATGTGDVLIALSRDTQKVRMGLGLDPAGRMLAVARDKIRRRGASTRLGLAQGDATCLGLADASFDAVTMAFGIRNMPDVGMALAEAYRVLKPGGRLLILEFSLPSNWVIRAGYLFYLRHVLPFIGGMISGDRQAYRYLNETIESFPHGEAFCSLLRAAAWNQVEAIPLTFGIATLYVAEKQSE